MRKPALCLFALALAALTAGADHHEFTTIFDGKDLSKIETEGNWKIQGTFDGNLLDGLNDQPQIVHPRGIGYTVNPGDQTLAADGTPLIPLPMNQNVSEAQKLFYTWRDTGLQARGGPSGFGVRCNSRSSSHWHRHSNRSCSC